MELRLTEYLSNGKEVIKENTFTPIVSLSLNNEIESDLFLGTGNINGEIYYYFYVKDNNKYKLNKLKAEETDIVEDNNPRLEKKVITTMYKQTPGKLEKFLGLNISNTNWVEESYGFFTKPTKLEYTLYIPKGSIKEDFSVDLSIGNK